MNPKVLSALAALTSKYYPKLVELFSKRPGLLRKVVEKSGPTVGKDLVLIKQGVSNTPGKVSLLKRVISDVAAMGIIDSLVEKDYSFLDEWEREVLSLFDGDSDKDTVIKVTTTTSQSSMNNSNQYGSDEAWSYETDHIVDVPVKSATATEMVTYNVHGATRVTPVQTVSLVRTPNGVQPVTEKLTFSSINLQHQAEKYKIDPEKVKAVRNLIQFAGTLDNLYSLIYMLKEMKQEDLDNFVNFRNSIHEYI